LTTDYGAGFSRQNLFHVIRFAEAWPDQAQVVPLAEHLGWSHLKEILYLKDELARQFYSEICRLERWSVRTLRRPRTQHAISKLPEATIRQDLEPARAGDFDSNRDVSSDHGIAGSVLVFPPCNGPR
jgi:hypothetical protein